MLFVIFLLAAGATSVEVELRKTEVILSSGCSLIGTKWNVDGRHVGAYLGIPFAKPPVEELRFKPPAPAGPLQGVFNATKLPNACWQYMFGKFDLANAGARIWTNNTQMSEDCLYLNVWAPTDRPIGSPLLPVMIWIFGGGFFSGTSTLDVYDGRFLAAKEGVIVVSMQYRLGAFGFLYIQGHIEGNMGLLDQRAAMGWVQQHISSFGGDPHQVTLFGESSGAVSISFHYLMPESRKLFKRIILQSAGPFHKWAISDSTTAHDTGLAFIKANNCSNDDGSYFNAISCLQRTHAQQLVSKLYEMNTASTARREKHLESMRPTMRPASSITTGANFFEVMMKPVIDGRIISDCPTNLLKSIQDVNKSDVLIGSMENEGMFWLFYGLEIDGIKIIHDDGRVTFPTSEQLRSIDFVQLVANRFTSMGDLTHPFPTLTALQYGLESPLNSQITGYNSGVAISKVGSDFMKILDDLSGEMEFVCGTKLFARLLARIKGANVQYYNFEHKTKNAPFPEIAGAMHGYEIEYVFGMPFSNKFQNDFYSFTQEEKNLSLRVMRHWANFARTGFADQNPDGSRDAIQWPRINETTEPYMVISLQNAQIKTNLRAKGCTYWNYIYPSLTRIHLKKSGYRWLGQNVCPHLETNLFPLEPLRKFVKGKYFDGSSAVMYGLFVYCYMVLVIFD